MLPSSKPFLADEELGKKDDDHRPPPPHWRPQQWKPPRPRRLLLAIVVFGFLYLFFKNMPTDLPPARVRFNPAIAEARQRATKSWSRPLPSLPAIQHHGPPPRDEDESDDQEQKDDFYYNGEVRFDSLAKTLAPFWRVPGRHGIPASRAVVFAGASLQGISDMLPLACRMAERRVNDVHLVLLGRNGVSIEGIRHVNGLDERSCPIVWHDSRANYAQWSTDARMERAVISGLDYICAYLRPQAIITQSGSLEETFFTKGAQWLTKKHGVAHVVLPSVAREVMWMSALDSNALRAWNDVHIEILIQAQSDSAGSLIRLIRSLKNADYLGTIPSLTIELPSQVDSQLLLFLQKMDWPPSALSKMTIRRHIESHPSPIEASLRTVEGFYPRDPSTTHVLLLSPQAELAPSFFHYLKYTILNYRHSADFKHTGSKLFGISLELPSSNLAGNEPLNPPDMNEGSSTNPSIKESLPLFLWEAPNSNAALYFGDKWAELHSFLSSRFSTQETKPPDKSISKQYHAFMEYATELIRARGYYMLYPTFPARGTSPLATVHEDLYQIPEEFNQDESTDATGIPEEIGDPSKPLTDDFVKRLGLAEKPLPRTANMMPLLEQFSLQLPQIENLPTLSYAGEALSHGELSQRSEEYRRQFRRRHGGCQDDTWEVNPGSLFC